MPSKTDLRTKGANMKKLEYPKDCKRIVKVALKYGKINDKEAQYIWKTYSNDFAAGWLILPDSDADLWEIIKEYLR